MDNELKQDFTRRLSQCNKGEMIVIIYDIFFAYAEDVRKAWQIQNTVAFKAGIRNTQRVLDELIGALDFQYEISQTLYSLYIYCKQILSKTLYENRLDHLDETETIMKRLYSSFVEVAKQDTSEPLMSNTQQVYAGITYGRNTLNENLVNDNQRGFWV